MIIEAHRSHLLVIDIQERLTPAMAQAEDMIANVGRLMTGARLAKVPMTVSEQYPKGLGTTVGEIAERAEASEVFAKLHFSCAADDQLSSRFANSDRDLFVLCGIEAHVCVLQTALGLKASGYDVVVVADAITSRHRDSVRLAQDRLRSAGITIASVEMVLFEWTEKADTNLFREMRKLIV